MPFVLLALLPGLQKVHQPDVLQLMGYFFVRQFNLLLVRLIANCNLHRVYPPNWLLRQFSEVCDERKSRSSEIIFATGT